MESKTLLRSLCAFTLALAASLFAGISADAQESATYMLKPHDVLPSGADTTGFTKIFLAGTIDMGNSRDWQAELHDCSRRGRIPGPDATTGGKV